MKYDRYEERFIERIKDTLNKDKDTDLTTDQVKAVIAGQSTAIKASIELGIAIRLPYAGKFITKANVLVQQDDGRRRHTGVKDSLKLMKDEKLTKSLIKAKTKELERMKKILQYNYQVSEQGALSFLAELTKGKYLTK